MHYQRPAGALSATDLKTERGYTQADQCHEGKVICAGRLHYIVHRAMILLVRTSK
jgi:hypothetical protein